MYHKVLSENDFICIWNTDANYNPVKRSWVNSKKPNRILKINIIWIE